MWTLDSNILQERERIGENDDNKIKERTKRLRISYYC